MRWYVLCPLLIALIQRSRIPFGLIALGCYALYASPYAIADEGTLPTFMLGIAAAELAATRGRHAGWLSMVTPPLVATELISQAHVAVVDHGNPLWPWPHFYSWSPRREDHSVADSRRAPDRNPRASTATSQSSSSSDSASSRRSGAPAARRTEPGVRSASGACMAPSVVAIGRRSMSSRASSAIRTARMAGA